MTNADSCGVSQAAFSSSTLGAAAGAGSIVFSGIRQNTQLLFYLHLPKVDVWGRDYVLFDLSSHALGMLRRSFFEIAGFFEGPQAEIEVTGGFEL